MKVGSQNSPKLIAAGVLSTVALLLVARSILDLQAPLVPGASAVATVRTESARMRTAEYLGQFDPTLNSAKLRLSEGKFYEGTGRDIFSVSVGRGTDQPRSQTRSSPPNPTARLSISPFGLKFFGFARAPNAPMTIFLSQNDDVFIGGVGDIVDRRYRIVRIAPESVDVQDLLDDSPHTLTLQPG